MAESKTDQSEPDPVEWAAMAFYDFWPDQYKPEVRPGLVKRWSELTRDEQQWYRDRASAVVTNHWLAERKREELHAA